MNRLARMAALAVGLGAMSGTVAADAPAAPPATNQIIKVWPGAAPGSEKWTQRETESKFGDARIIRNVVSPTLEAYLPEKGAANGTGVIVCPGGAFQFLSIDSEGIQVAKWFASKGVAAFVLRYRLAETAETDLKFTFQMMGVLPPLFKSGEALTKAMQQYGPPAIADGREALKLLRTRAAEFGLKPDRIGILGFSAGGVVATGVSTEYDAASRPDFFAAIYPGAWPIAKMPADAPPLFIAATNDDSITPHGAKPLEATWKAAGKPVQAQYYPTGGHGFGMKKQGKPSDVWTDQLLAWLDGLGFLKTAK